LPKEILNYEEDKSSKKVVTEESKVRPPKAPY